MPLNEEQIPGYELRYTEGDNLPYYAPVNPLYDRAPVQAAPLPLPVDVTGIGVVPTDTTGFKAADKLLGIGGQERYQTWPEKMVRNALAAPHDVLNNPQPMTSEDLIKPANDIAALAGGGSIPFAGKGALGSFGGKLVQVEHDPFAAPTFYSALEKAIENTSQAKMSGEQWLGTLKNKSGVKPEEIEYTGLENFLAGKQNATKQEVQGFIKNNKVELKEVNKGGEINSKGWTVKEAKNGWGVYDENGKFQGNAVKDRQSTAQDAIDFVANQNKNLDTKFSQWQLPGGENYRETLLTLPPTPKVKEVFEVRPREGKNPFAVYLKGEREHMRSFATKDEADVFAAKQNEHAFEMSNDFKSSHWDEPNVLTHMRMNDRVIDGKKSLHIEEIQSDAHQLGRQTGYKISPELKVKADKIDEKLLAHSDAEKIMGNPDLNAALKEAVDKKIITQAEADTYAKVTKNENATVPDFPFKKTWHELALKRALREAVEGGYQRLSITPGEAQAARYDLSKQVKEIKYIKYPDGSYRLGILGHNGEGIETPQFAYTAKELPNVVGKEVADKIINDKGKKYRGHEGKTLDNLDLKIGGEGMKGFYDQIIPKALEKISGEKVKSGDIGNAKIVKTSQGWVNRNHKGERAPEVFKTKEEAEKASGQLIHYIDITPALKEKAMKGFPLFSGGLPLIPVDHDPYKHKLVPVEINPFE